METLNIGAGQTDQEYKAAQEQHCADLQAEIRSNAFYFFIAGGLAALGTGVLPLRIGIFVNIGAIDLLTLYGGLAHNPLLLRLAASAWVGILVALGFAAQKGYRWAFIGGLILYGADIVALGMMFSIWSVGVHGFFVFKWFQGQKAVQDLKTATASLAEAATKQA
jgi:hypothetical protein